MVKFSTRAMLQMDLVLGEERCVGHELDEDDEATFKVAAESKSKEADKQQVVVTVCYHFPHIFLLSHLLLF